MQTLRQLTPQDVLFVGGETPRIYQHTVGLMLIDGRDRPGFGFEAFRRHTQERLGRIPHFRWKLHEVPLGLDLPYWVEDDRFSFDYHIRRIAVPSPGNREALAEVVSYLYSSHLDRNRPLWEAWFIEGMPDGQFAVVHKMHHCMMDGEGASKLLEILCDFTRDATPAELDRAIAKAQAGEVPQLWRQGRDGNPADAAAPARERRGPYRTGAPGRQAHGRRVSDVDPWLLVAGLDRALGEYLALTGKSATRSKARGAGSRAGRTATSGARKPAGAPKRSTGGKRAS